MSAYVCAAGWRVLASALVPPLAITRTGSVGGAEIASLGGRAIASDRPGELRARGFEGGGGGGASAQDEALLARTPGGKQRAGVGGGGRGRGAYAMSMKKSVLGATVFDGAAVRPKASASVSKHAVSVHTVCCCSESRISCAPGLVGVFWQTQFIRSSHIVMAARRLGVGGVVRGVLRKPTRAAPDQTLARPPRARTFRAPGPRAGRRLQIVQSGSRQDD